jgi:hypothetical protein
MFSQTLIERLHRIEEAPWADWSDGRHNSHPLTPRDLARLLNPFGVSSHQVRIGGTAGKKGYRRADLLPQWERHTPEKGLQGLQDLQINAHGMGDVDPVDDVDLFSGYVQDGGEIESSPGKGRPDDR